MTPAAPFVQTDLHGVWLLMLLAGLFGVAQVIRFVVLARRGVWVEAVARLAIPVVLFGGVIVEYRHGAGR